MEKQFEQFMKDLEKQTKAGIEQWLTNLYHNNKKPEQYSTVHLIVDEKTLTVKVSTTKSDDDIILSHYTTCRKGLIKLEEHNAKLYNCLTPSERNAYLLRQQLLYDNGDFMFYDVDYELFDYAASMFTESFEKFVKAKVKEMSKRVIEDKSFDIVRSKYLKILKQHLVKDEVLDRVKDELKDLETRAEKLKDFISQKKHFNLNNAQQNLLPLQLDYMDNLIRVLKSRIEHWFDENEEVTD